MTFPDVRRLFAYWRRYPPVRDLVAAFVGFRPEPARGGVASRDGAEMLVTMCPDGKVRF